MSALITTTAAAGGLDIGFAVPGAWDLKSALENSTTYAQAVGGGFLTLLGVVAIIYGGYLLVKKLMAGQQNQDSWIKIIILIIVGGALSVSGFALISEIAAGGEQTIKDLGNTPAGGTILPLIDIVQAIPPLF